MKKILFWLIAVLTVFLLTTVFADFTLPGSLTVIEEEAFMGDTSITGLFSVPAQVERIERDAFSGTGLFAVEIPGSVQEVGPQRFSNAGYVLFAGDATTIHSLEGISYLIGPEQSSAADWAGENNLAFVPLQDLVKYNGFYYRNDPDGLTLMSAVDSDLVGSEIWIPREINGKPVTAVAPFAFTGCPQVQSVRMPETLMEAWNQSGYDECPGIEFDVYSETLVRNVKANIASGTVGQKITWTVETEEGTDIVRYDYMLYMDGMLIDEATSESASYSYSVSSAGAYQLSVSVVSGSGITGNGSSSLLYIAVENMKMTVPSTLANGKDLTVTVLEVPGAYFYGVYLTEESTGKSVGYRTIDKPGQVTFEGYLLNKGTYRVSGYVFGNSFRYTVPTVKTVTVTGTKSAGPQIQNQQPITYESDYLVQKQGAEKQVVSYRFRYGDGTLSEEQEICSTGNIWIWVGGEYEKWKDGGALLIKRAVKKNGAWTAWGPTAEISIIQPSGLDIPAVTAPETLEAGKDLVISFESVENADRYSVALCIGRDTDEYYEGKYVFGCDYSRGQTVVIPGYDLSAGWHTLTVSAYSESGDYSGSHYIQYIEITGSRPEAPEVSTDKTERFVTGGSVQVSVRAPGAEGAYIRRVFYKNGREVENWGMISLSLDEDGNGSYRDSNNYGEDRAGCTLFYQVTAVYDGTWSEFGSAEVLLKKQDPLPAPVVEASAEHIAGMDYVFRFSPVEGADSYRAYFYQAYSNDSICSWYSDTAKPDRDLTVPGYYLSKGNYRLVVRAYSEERGSNEKEVSIRVTGTRPSAPDVTVNNEEFHIKDRLVFTVDTADAEELMVFYDESSLQFHNRNSRKVTVTGDESTWRYTIDEDLLDKEYSFSFSVKKGGTWSSWKEIKKTILDLPPLAVPSIHVNAAYEAGEDVSITFDAVENAQCYEYTLYKNGDYYSWDSAYEPRVITYSGADLDPGDYCFSIRAVSEDYANSTAEAVFRITGTKTHWVQPEVSQTEVEAGDSVTFTFDTGNVEEIYCERVYYSNEENEEYWTDWEGTINVLEESTKWTAQMDSEGVYGYRFSALINGRWTAWTQEIRITVNGSGETELPDLELPDTLPLGQDLTVTVGPMEKANSFSVYLYNSSGTRVGSKSISGNSGGTVTFDGYGLALGRNRVRVDIYAGNTWYYLEKQFSVISNTRPQAPEVVPDTSVGRVNVRYGFTVNTPGADKIAVRYYREDNTNDISYTTANATEDTTYWYHTRSTSGTTWKYAFSVRVDGTWSPWSPIYTVRITDREQLASPVIRANETVEAGQDLYISFDAVENAESYRMYLYYPDGNYNSWYNAYPDTERRLMGYNLDPGTYRVVVTASGTEYESSTAEKIIRITGTRPAAPEVSVSSQEVFSGESVTFVIVSSGAEEIVYKYEYSGGWSSSGTLNVLLSEPTAWDTCIDESGSVRYSFAILKDGKWSQWSTPTEITVKSRPALGVPEVTVPESITQGMDLTVTVGDVENVSHYYVYLYDNREKEIAYKYMQAAGDAVFSGYRLPVGSLRVEINAYGNNNGSSRVSRNLTVTSGTRPAAPSVTPPESLTVSARTEYFFGIDTAGAEKAVVRYFRIGNPNDLYYSEFNAADGDTTSWRGYQYNGGVQYAYSFSVQKDGVWSEWSSFTIVSIE